VARRQGAGPASQQLGNRGLAIPRGNWIGRQISIITNHFYTEQPDLNWRNPQVRKAMYDAMRFWLDRGVAGFRIDAVSRLFEDPNLHDDPILPGKNAYG